MKIPQDYVEKVYAGWLGKAIGVRLGAPVEGWTYETIRKTFGKVTDYIVDYRDFAADDDTNGPLFFLRTLEDYGLDASDDKFGLSWLNYPPYEHGFYWWGGYGKSTEHTAYLNLRSGIPAPRSGSVLQNGAAVAEQIGGQIFIDTWGLIAPNNVALAASYAKKAASVSHGGNGVYGGMFIAACIAKAFGEQDILSIIRAGLSVIPADSEYARVVNDVIAFHQAHPEDWEKCYRFLFENYGYDRYPGACHIIPNSGVIVLSLLYSNGSFSDALNICNMCGWDTDCNAANVGTIMGVRGGLEGIDYDKWRRPINDFLACSSVIGSLNIMDMPTAAYYIAKIGYRLAGETPAGKWADILDGKAPKFGFELPGSTHAFRFKADDGKALEGMLCNTEEESFEGDRCLKVVAKPLREGLAVKVFYKTYYEPSDFHDSRYDPSFSPVFYPGQTVRCAVMVPDFVRGTVVASLYVNDRNTGMDVDSPSSAVLVPGQWAQLSFDVPRMDGACIREAGIKLRTQNGGLENTLTAYVDSFDLSGGVDYNIDFGKERMEVWPQLHREVSQFTYLKGIWDLDGGELIGSVSDFGEAYTGSYDLKNYTFTATLIPQIGSHHSINVRVQGAIRSYAVGLRKNGRLVIDKNDNGYTEVASADFLWQQGRAYTLTVKVIEDRIEVFYQETPVLSWQDEHAPYLTGQVGVSLSNGSRCHFKDFIIQSI